MKQLPRTESFVRWAFCSGSTPSIYFSWAKVILQHYRQGRRLRKEIPTALFLMGTHLCLGSRSATFQNGALMSSLLFLLMQGKESVTIMGWGCRIPAVEGAAVGIGPHISKNGITGHPGQACYRWLLVPNIRANQIICNRVSQSGILGQVIPYC